jgi:hypothetical protein
MVLEEGLLSQERQISESDSRIARGCYRTSLLETVRSDLFMDLCAGSIEPR